MGRFKDKELENSSVIFATAAFYDADALMVESKGNVEKYLSGEYEKLKKQLSAYCATHRGLRIGTLICVGKMMGFGGYNEAGVRLIGGGNLANVLEPFGCDNFALYVVGDELWFKGYFAGKAEPECYVIREVSIGQDVTMLYNSARNAKGTKGIDIVRKGSNSIGKQIIKAIGNWEYVK